MDKLKTALIESLRAGRVLTKSYVNQNFKQEELQLLEDTCKDELQMIEIAIEGNIERSLGLSQFHAKVLQRILKTNLDAIRTIRKDNMGITEVKSKLFNFDISQN